MRLFDPDFMIFFWNNDQNYIFKRKNSFAKKLKMLLTTYNFIFLNFNLQLQNICIYVGIENVNENFA